MRDVGRDLAAKSNWEAVPVVVVAGIPLRVAVHPAGRYLVSYAQALTRASRGS
jgi:hypothetical protein